MLHQLRRAAPEIDFRAVNDRASCRYMKMITPDKLLRSLRDGTRRGARRPRARRPGARGGPADDRDRAARGRRNDARPGRPRPTWSSSGPASPGSPPRWTPPSSGLRVVVVTKDAARRRAAPAGRRAASRSCSATCPDDSVDAHIDRHPHRGRRAVRRRRGRDDPRPRARPRSRGCAPAARSSTPTRDGRLARTREGGHSAFRVIHAGGDATGAEIERALVAGSATGGCRCSPGTSPSTCCGPSAGGRRRPRRARTTPGGRASCMRPRCCWPPAGTGSCTRAPPTRPRPPATASRSPCGPEPPLADLEFVQFHPDRALPGPARRRTRPVSRPLVTEAVRGEGAVLLDRAGRPVHGGRAPAGRPRPARRRGRGDHPAHWPTPAPTYVHARRHGHRRSSPRRFPTVYAACRAVGYRPRPGADPGHARPRTTRAAEWSPTCTGAPPYPGCTPRARWLAPACTAPTGWRPTACWRDSWSGGRAARAVAADRQVAAGQWASILTAAAAGGGARAALDRAARDDAWRPGSAATRPGSQSASDAVEAATGCRVPTDRTTVEDAALTLLAQAVLAAAGHRRETRGCHVRTDFPERDDVWQRSSLVDRARRQPDDGRRCRRAWRVAASTSVTDREPDLVDLTSRVVDDRAWRRTCATAPTRPPRPPCRPTPSLSRRSPRGRPGVLAGVPPCWPSSTPCWADGLRNGLGCDGSAGGFEVLDARSDGDRLAAGDAALAVRAPVRGLLTAERTALNLLCHLSGVATATAAWVDAVAGTGGSHPRHPQDHARACGCWRSTPCAAAAG